MVLHKWLWSTLHYNTHTYFLRQTKPNLWLNFGPWLITPTTEVNECLVGAWFSLFCLLEPHVKTEAWCHQYLTLCSSQNLPRHGLMNPPGFSFNNPKSSQPININAYIIIRITSDPMMQNRQAKKRYILFVSKSGPCVWMSITVSKSLSPFFECSPHSFLTNPSI